MDRIVGIDLGETTFDLAHRLIERATQVSVEKGPG